VVLSLLSLLIVSFKTRLRDGLYLNY